MKKSIVILCLALVLMTPLFAQGSKEESLQIGCAIYKFDDTFMTSVRNAISDASIGKAKIDIVDSENSQAKQNEKVDMFITKGVNSLAINPVDRTAAGVIVNEQNGIHIL